MKKKSALLAAVLIVLVQISTSCFREKPQKGEEVIQTMNLKTGDVTWCGPPEKEFGSVEFTTSCSPKVKTKSDHLKRGLLLKKEEMNRQSNL